MDKQDYQKKRKLKNPAADEIEHLRKNSRQSYFKERERKKLEEFLDDVEDEAYLFQGVKLSQAERRNLEYKKRVSELLVEKQRLGDLDAVDEYRMPNAYDRDAAIDQAKRFRVALQPCGEPREQPETSWEGYQLGKAVLRFGSKNKAPVTPDQNYEYVFEDLIEFVKTSSIGDNNCEQQQPPDLHKEDRSSGFKAIAFEEDRKNLPIYKFKDDLVRAVRDHQVLIIVGETGSGKTTQIPQYLHEAGYTNHGKLIACTQPRRVAAMSVAARVSKEMGVKLGHEVGYSIRFEDCTSRKTVIKYMTDGRLLKEFIDEPDLGSYSVVMVDEAHERTLSTDILFGLLKDLVRFRSDLKLLISSATLDAEKFSNFFDSAPMFIIPGRRYPVSIEHITSPLTDYVDAAADTVLQVHATKPPGDILVFLTGQEEIEEVEEILQNRVRALGRKVGELIICPILANLPTELQVKIFAPTPEGARKVVLATNIAETSLTIDGIKYVIDTGFCKMKSYDPRTGTESLLVTPISKASATQRAGRAGRTGPGVCYRLYTSHCYEAELEDNTMPEMQRTNMANVVLTLKCLGINDLLSFDFMDRPRSEAISKALELLYALGALNKLGELTKTGRKMAELPLDPLLSKMVVASEKYKCSDEIISIAAMLSVDSSIFYRPKRKRVLCDSVWMQFYEGDVGDHVALLRVYNSWKENNYSSQWCYENYIQFRSMKRARDIRKQLEGLLQTVGIELVSNDLTNLDSIKMAILSGFFPHTALLQPQLSGFSYRTLKNREAVLIHPSSGLSQAQPRPVLVIYHELVLTSKKFIRQVTEVKPKWLLEIAPHYYDIKEIVRSKAQKPSKVCSLHC